MAKKVKIETPEKARNSSKKIKLTAIWHADNQETTFTTNSFTVMNHPFGYYVKLADGYTFLCSSFSVEKI